MEQIIISANKPMDAHVSIPGSKSMTNRALLLAALAEGISSIKGLLLCDDTYAMMEALRQLGISLQLDTIEKSCFIEGGQGRFPTSKASIGCHSAGTVARFLLAACANQPGEFKFEATEQLSRRPLLSLIETLKTQGIAFSPADAKQMPFQMKVTEGLRGGIININGNETGQFISALLMIAPLAQQTVEIQTDTIVSRSYVDMTCAMMAEFGVSVEQPHQDCFIVPVPQTYKAVNYIVEPDLSTASYFFAAAAITGGRVTTQPFERQQSKQGDANFLLLLEKMGCEIIETSLYFAVKGPKRLQGVEVDMCHFSDTFMTLAAIAPFATSPTTITGLGHTRLQESNRLTAMCEGLQKLNVKVEAGKDWLRIYPSHARGAVIDSHGDHRIAMAFSVIGVRVPGIVIQGAECVSKTCPDFFKLWKSILSF